MTVCVLAWPDPMAGVMRDIHLGGRHSRRVDRLRFLLPTVALLLLAAVMAWPWVGGGYHGLIVPIFADSFDQENDAMRMAKPRYVGRTQEAEAYEVTAVSAFLDPANQNRIRLDRLQAVFEPAGEKTVHLRADEGVYLRKQDFLELDGDLELTFGEGYRFTTESADVDLERGYVTGREPVSGNGPLGAVAADGFDIEDGGRLLRFEGRVHVTILPAEPAI